ncbi:2-keto-4-pentenoate hydratase [Trinickia mobilis]|uniref:2-keto-4-pentenoate hydratase n=1 Tax=Trinickia mobilis TaxID=2816356 RepID=UPI001A8D1A37|nr:fumarylacetoacetate hydrolase family protein [Trinickia mobilis]
MNESRNAFNDFWDAAWNSRPTPRQWCGKLSPEEGYAVQLDVGDRYADHGVRRFGWKVGAPSKAVQKQLGLTEPVYGTVFEKNVHWANAVLAIDTLIGPHIECELAFRLNSKIQTAKNLDDVASAVGFVYPAFEYIEKRVPMSDLGVAIADNSEHTGIVLGRPIRPEVDFDYSRVVCKQFFNGIERASATGAVIMEGNPLGSILWMKKILEKHGRQLGDGDLVMTGSFIRQTPIAPGDVVRAEFSGVGSVQVTIAR